MNPVTPPPQALQGRVQLDEAALARLRELDPDGHHGVLARVLAAFETSLSRMLTQLRAESASAHPQMVAGVAHTLKSSSASVGAMELARACSEVEIRLRNGDTSALQVDIARLIAEGESALRTVAAMLRP